MVLLPVKNNIYIYIYNGLYNNSLYEIIIKQVIVYKAYRGYFATLKAVLQPQVNYSTNIHAASLFHSVCVSVLRVRVCVRAYKHAAVSIC